MVWQASPSCCLSPHSQCRDGRPIPPLLTISSFAQGCMHSVLTLRPPQILSSSRPVSMVLHAWDVSSKWNHTTLIPVCLASRTCHMLSRFLHAAASILWRQCPFCVHLSADKCFHFCLFFLQKNAAESALWKFWGAQIVLLVLDTFSEVKFLGHKVSLYFTS